MGRNHRDSSPWVDQTPVASVGDYRRALKAVRDDPGISGQQFDMLRAHVNAPQHTATAKALAGAAHYDSYRVANSQYGKFAHNLAAELHHRPVVRGNPRWWLTVAYGLDESDPARSDGQYRWVMRDELVQALQQMRWDR